MSVDYTTCLCYGMVIPYEIAEKINERLNDENYDIFHDKFLHILNGWGDGEEGYLLGFTTPLGEECIEIPLDEIINKQVYTPDGIKEFYEFYDLLQLNDFIRWKPQKSIITFCW
jgi:hypothetical protein